jgi:hypothetical protein
MEHFMLDVCAGDMGEVSVLFDVFRFYKKLKTSCLLDVSSISKILETSQLPELN